VSDRVCERRRSRRARAALVALGLLVLGGACRLDVDVNVTVEPDGSGFVEVVAALDDAALERVGGDLGAVLALDDLEATGWEVRGPDREGDDRTRVRVRKGFDDPDAASSALAEVAGEDGPFRDLEVTRRRSFARTTWEFRGVVDLSGGAGAFGDEELAEALDGEPLGQSIEDLERQLGATLDRLVGLRVSVRLPGEVTSNAATRIANGAVWELSLGRGPAELAATGTERRTAVLAWVGAGAVLALVASVWVLVRIAVRVTDRRRGAAAPEEPTGEEPIGEEPIGEEPIGEEPIGEEPIGDAPRAEDDDGAPRA
jgi:hypothetical protein